MKFFIFHSSECMDKTLKEKLNPNEENGLEYSVLDKFDSFRVLFVAPHAHVRKIYLKKYGRNAYTVVGDKNTGRLTRLAALHTRTGYLIPKVLRISADPARDPDDLGKGMKLLVPLYHSETNKKKIKMVIHRDEKFKPFLFKFHEVIENFKTKSIVQIHGMHKRHKFDILLGFGKDYLGIGGKNRAFKLREEFVRKCDEIFENFRMKNDIKIGIAKKLFVGRENYILNKHVISYNNYDEHDDKRMGFIAEFNLRGRTSKNDKNLPTMKYQLAVQVLADVVVNWSKKI